MQVLLEHNKAEVLQQWHDIMPALLDALTSQSDGVVNQARTSTPRHDENTCSDPFYLFPVPRLFWLITQCENQVPIRTSVE